MQTDPAHAEAPPPAPLSRLSKKAANLDPLSRTSRIAALPPVKAGGIIPEPPLLPIPVNIPALPDGPAKPGVTATEETAAPEKPQKPVASEPLSRADTALQLTIRVPETEPAAPPARAISNQEPALAPPPDLPAPVEHKATAAIFHTETGKHRPRIREHSRDRPGKSARNASGPAARRTRNENP